MPNIPPVCTVCGKEILGWVRNNNKHILMKHLTPYRQNETSLSPVRGRGMVYGGGMMSENSTEIFQVAFSTLERSKICLGCQYPNRYIGEVHLNKGQSGELCLNISYACRALSFSSSDTGDGWFMCQRKRSASLPVSTGVSLIGLAIINLYLVSAANLRIISE